MSHSKVQLEYYVEKEAPGLIRLRSFTDNKAQVLV